MADLWARHTVTGLVGLTVKIGAAERKLNVGLFGQQAPVHAQAFRQMCQAAQRGAGKEAQGLKGQAFYRYNEDVGFWFGDVNQLREQQIKLESGARSEHFQYCLTSVGSDASMVSNVWLLVTAPAVDFLNDKHVVFGQLLDAESVNTVEEMRKYAIVESCGRLSENSALLIKDVSYADQM